jgi:putative ABC transport system permease protein
MIEIIHILLARLRVMFRRNAVIKDIDEEMRLHVEMQQQNYIERGMRKEEARWTALRSFGNLGMMRDIGFESRGGRLSHGGNIMDGLLQDVRYGLRTLLKTRGFTLVAVSTLGLGIGATSAVFSLIQGVLLSPPPYQKPEQLALIEPLRADLQEPSADGWPAAQWMEWQKQSKSLEAVAAYGWTFNFLVLPDGSESIEGMWVTPDYFNALGLKPLLGRTFAEADAAHGAAPVTILGSDLWQRTYNRDPNIVGKTIQISRFDAPVTVVGVMPPGVRFLPSLGASKEPNYNVNAQVDFWLAAVPDPARLKQPDWNVVARLRDGATLQEAQAEVAVLAAGQAQQDHDFDGIIPHFQSLTDQMNKDGRRILLPLLGAAGLVLLIACGNVAALLLVWGLGRQEEYAVRCALGARRATLFQQVSTQSLLLAFLGGALGVGLAIGIVRVFKVTAAHAIPRLDEVTAGWPVLLGGFVAAVLAAGLAGLVPALRASRLDAMQVIKSAGPKSSAGRGERRLLGLVVIAQTALTLVLLVGAGLLIRTMSNLAGVHTGYDTGHILTMSVTEVQGRQYWEGFHTQALERVSQLPGVEHAAFAWGVPLTGNNWPDAIEIEGQPPASKPSDRTSQPLRAITEDYFNLMGLAVLEGREFRSTDKEKAPNVAIVNQEFANHYFPSAVAVGKKIWLSGRERPSTEIIGVVTNGRTDDLAQAAAPEVYLPLWQAQAFSKHLVVRTTADPRSLVVAVERELRSVDSTAAVENVKTLDQIRRDSLGSRAFAMQLLVGFAAIASVLTLVGIYGVLSLSVGARRREIAIRAAIGAQRQTILLLVLMEGLRLIAIGVVAGLAAAIVLSRVLTTFLFEVKPTDPATLIAVALLFVLVALLACWVPARRAVKVDPIAALRYE